MEPANATVEGGPQCSWGVGGNLGFLYGPVFPGEKADLPFAYVNEI